MTASDIDNFLSLFPKNLMEVSEEEQKLSILLYQLIAKGRPVSLAVLANEYDQPMGQVESILGNWGSEVHWDDDKNIVGFFGLDLNKTAHEFVVNGVTLYTWCAWDTFFIPALIDQTAEVKSHCPVTKQEVKLTISPAAVEGASPTGTVVSLVEPDTENIGDDVTGTFCCHIHFFSSPEVGASWSTQNAGTKIVSLADAFLLGKRKNEKRYPNLF